MNNLKHAKAIINKLTSRPLLEDDEGNLDMYEDERQCIGIVREYLDKKFKK
jgi:hypothetical protein